MNKNGNSVLDNIDPDELINYVLSNYYQEVKDYVMENEAEAQD